MDAFYTICGEDSYRNILGDYSFAVTADIGVEAFFAEGIIVEGIYIGGVLEESRAFAVGYCAGYDGEREHWHAIFFGKADGGGGRIYCGFEGAMEGWEG